LRVATWNIHRGRPAFGPFRPERVAPVLAEIGADLVALQEAQHHFDRARPMLDEAALDRLAGLRVLRASADQQGWRANVLLARPTLRVLRGPLPLNLGGLEPRGGLIAEVEGGAGPVRVAAAHLSLTAERRRLQAGLILAALHAGERMPCLLMGDLNEARPDRGAMAALVGAFPSPAAVPTFPSFRPRLALDRIMVCPGAMLASLGVHDTPAARRASDHLPLVAELVRA
jgi:endonuclease/exonuclease/phosphatase family metal-dependent hydrolase